MFGAYSSVNSRSVAWMPARKWSNIWLWPPSRLSSAKTMVPSCPRSERWMWQELPSRWSYLAMNVSDWPWTAAISLAAFL